MTERQPQRVVDAEQADLSVRSERSEDVRFEVLFRIVERISDQIAMLRWLDTVYLVALLCEETLITSRET